MICATSTLAQTSKMSDSSNWMQLEVLSFMPTGDLDVRCSSVLLEVVFNKGKSPLPDGQMERKARARFDGRKGCKVLTWRQMAPRCQQKHLAFPFSWWSATLLTGVFSLRRDLACFSIKLLMLLWRLSDCSDLRKYSTRILSPRLERISSGGTLARARRVQCQMVFKQM